MLLVCHLAALLAVLHGAEVCERAGVGQLVMAQLTDPVWCCFAEFGKNNMAGLVASRIF